MADPPTYDCRLRAVEQYDLTVRAHRGVLAGVIVHAAAEVSIRCYITVDDVQVDTTIASGTDIAATQKRVSFVADDTDVVRVCAEYTSTHGSGTRCVLADDAISRLVQVTNDTVDAVLWQVWPIVPSICLYLQQLVGTYGTPPGPVVVITVEGDVYVDDELQWDCPPYETVWD